MGIRDIFKKDETKPAGQGGELAPPRNAPVQATRLKIEQQMDGLVRMTIHSGPLESYSFLLPAELSSDLQVALTNITGLSAEDSDIR